MSCLSKPTNQNEQITINLKKKGCKYQPKSPLQRTQRHFLLQLGVAKYFHTSPALSAAEKAPKPKKFVIYRYNPHTPEVKPHVQQYEIDLNQ